MRFANNILENYYRVAHGIEPWGQLGGMGKLLTKGGNGKFWAKDFGITGAEMVGLAYLPIDIIKPTGKTAEVEITLTYWDWETQSEKPFTKKVEVKEWELLDYDRLAKAYELLTALIML
jgi:hypothetical protein